MIEGSSLVRPFLQTGENLESLSCIFGLLYVHSFRFKVVQRLGVSVAAPPRHFPRSITKISSFCASLRPCCVFSFRRPRCFLISFKSCRAANSASSACFPLGRLALARPPLPLARPPVRRAHRCSQPCTTGRSGSPQPDRGLDVLLLRVAKIGEKTVIVYPMVYQFNGNGLYYHLTLLRMRYGSCKKKSRMASQFHK